MITQIRIFCNCGWEEWLDDIETKEEVNEESGRRLALHMWDAHQVDLSQQKMVHTHHETIQPEKLLS